MASVVQAGSTVALDYTAPTQNPLRESGGGPGVADLDGHSVSYTTHIYEGLAVDEDYRLGGVWSDGDTMWVGKLDNRRNGSNNYLRAYDLSTGLRDSTKDLQITAGLSRDSHIRGLWSDGDYMWVSISTTGASAKIYAYRMNPGGHGHGNRASSRDIQIAGGLAVQQLQTHGYLVGRGDDVGYQRYLGFGCGVRVAGLGVSNEPGRRRPRPGSTRQGVPPLCGP